MTTSKCEYCLLDFRLVKRHQQNCKAKVEYDKNKIIKQNSMKKFSENYDIKIKSIINLLPNELLLIIKSYLIPESNKINKIKDKYCSYYKFYKERMSYCYISKKLYNVFYPSYDDIIIYKKDLKDERDTRICKTTAKTEYKLKEDELENNINYELFYNPHYKSSPPMKIYQISDILDYMGQKYGSYAKHMEELNEIEYKKMLSKEKRNELQDKRRDKINELIDKYNNMNNNNNNINYNIRIVTDKYYNDYINKGTPSFKKIQEEIKLYINKEDRKNEITNMLNKNQWLKYKNNKIIKNYIDTGENSYGYVFVTIQNIYNREKQLNQLLNSDNYLYDKDNCDMINNYIYNGIGDCNEIINKIIQKDIRKNEVMEKFCANNLNYYNYSNSKFGKQLNDYINLNIGNINEVIEIITLQNNRKNELNEFIKNNNLSKNYLDELICVNYIKNGNDDINEIKKYIIVNDFYRKHTTYYYEKRRTNEDNSKKIALIKWCILNQPYENAIANVNLPIELHNNVFNIFNYDNIYDGNIYDIYNSVYNSKIDQHYNQNNNNNSQEKSQEKQNIQKHITCKCNNMVSLQCGMCSKCCNKIDCNKHSNKHKNK